MATRYDVAIIGTGAGGGTLAYALAPTGKNILLLERGDYVPREKDNWDTRAVNLEGRYNTKEVWRDRDGKELHPHTNYYVGGNTKFYGAALFRLRREDFGEVKHWGGVSPAWPIAYEDLEPYYTRAEQLYHVHGERGVDPTDPPARAPYPHPPVSHEPRIQQLADDWARLGRRPFHVPLGVMLDETNPRKSRCIRCATCDGHPCLVYAKSDAQVVCVDPALEHPNVTLVTNAHVTRLETSASGREVTHIVVERQGTPEAYAADVVVVACGAINSAALLLRSANDRHPRGLANGSDVVGRHYMGHVNSVLMALSKCPNPTVFQKTLALNDFYFGSAEWEYPMGHISFVGKLDGDTLRAGAPAIAPGWTLDLMARHSLDFWLTSEDLPDPDNRVTLDREGNIVLAYRPNNEEGHRRLAAELKRLMAQQTKCQVHGHECHEGLFARNLYLGQRIPLAGVAHQNGTIRFGRDPKTSALDVNCKAHELDNLYVVDASFFPSSAAVNPALPVLAHALPVGHEPLGGWGRGPTRIPRDRGVPPRGHDTGLDVRAGGRPSRETRVDGAGRQHDVRPLPRAPRARVRRAPAQGARQLSGLSRHHARRRLADGRGAGEARAARHGVRRRAAAPAPRRGCRGADRPHVASRVRPRPRARARARRRRGPPPCRDVPRVARAWHGADARPLRRGGAVARRRAGVAPPGQPRGADAGGVDACAGRRAKGARVDPAARPRGRPIRRQATVGGGSRRHERDRGLSLVRRLGARHDDQPRRADAHDRASRRRAADPHDIRPLCGPRHAAEPIPRRGRGARIQHRGRDALVRRGDSRLPRRDRRRRRPEGAVAGARRDRALASRGNALRDQAGRGRRPARLRRARRPAHLDGREGRRLGRDAAHRQAGRNQRALVQRARRAGGVRAAAGEARGAVGRSRRAREGGVRAVLEQGHGLLLRRDRRAGWPRRRAEAEPDLRRLAPREPALSRAPAQSRERLRPASRHVLRPQEPRAPPPAVPGPLRR